MRNLCFIYSSKYSASNDDVNNHTEQKFSHKSSQISLVVSHEMFTVIISFRIKKNLCGILLKGLFFCVFGQKLPLLMLFSIFLYA